MKTMKTILALLILLISINVKSQLATLTFTENPNGVEHQVGDHVQYCITVDNFTTDDCTYFDMLELHLTNATIVSYDLSPNSGWKHSTDLVGTGLGWGYDVDGDGLTMDDWGEDGSGPFTFCFTVEYLGGNTKVQASVWGDLECGSYIPFGFACTPTPITLETIYCNANLPVVLSHFNVINVNNKYNKVTWETLSEINNSHFEIQRSIDGYEWITIKEIEGSNNSNSPISYIYDDESYENIINYYRINQVDFNANNEYFEPVAVDNRTANIDKKIYKAYNLAGQQINHLSYTGVMIIHYTDGSVHTIKKIN